MVYERLGPEQATAMDGIGLNTLHGIVKKVACCQGYYFHIIIIIMSIAGAKLGNSGLYSNLNDIRMRASI
jgi:hypothetical protein